MAESRCEGTIQRVLDVDMIRLADVDDAQQISELWLEMVDYHHQFDPILFNASENGAEFYQQSIIGRLNDPNTRVLVAEENGEVVGYVLGMIADIMASVFQPVRSGFLADIYVSSDYRRQGIGQELVERLVLWFQSKDVTYYEWHVASENRDAVAFWQAMGGTTTMLRMRAKIKEDES